MLIIFSFARAVEAISGKVGAVYATVEVITCRVEA